MQPIEAYGGDDNASMAADNTSAYNCRRAGQANAPATASPHANGRAIDVNPYENPWVDPRCGCFRPSAKYGRVRTGTGVITKGGTAWTAFTRAGWIWQDSSTTDSQHFDTGYPSRPLARTQTTASVLAPVATAVRLPFPVPVRLGSATQVVTVKARGSYATVTAWQRTSTGWHRVLSTSAARVGSRGIVAGSTRRQGTSTTPAGTYGLTRAFGIRANPGSRLPYHRVGPDDWWVEDNRSAWYNTMRRGSAGGFDTRLPESDVNGSERLITHRVQYDYAVVINFNMAPAVRYRGAGIFLHVSDGHATAGCVAVPRTTMVAILRWLDPRAHPVIAIG
jgi:L,D-peptidoglycan transpeptidase YkuD (ErfK/YbiS/YcfS/YnhG family)